MIKLGALLLAGILAQDPAPAKEEIDTTLVALKGTVDVKRPEDKDWVPAERNMKLKKGSEICTAVASSATLLLTGNIKVEVKALTQAKVEDLAKQGQTLNADVKLKFGTIEVDIQKGDLRADMKVVTPNSTTSVSGSKGLVRAFATRGEFHWVTFRSQTGTWNHAVHDRDVQIAVQGAGVANSMGDTARDLYYVNTSDSFLNFFGKNPTELNKDACGVGVGDVQTGLIPLYELGGALNPVSGAFNQPSTLPGPPPHP